MYLKPYGGLERDLWSERGTPAEASLKRFTRNLLQGYLAHKKLPPPRTRQQDYAQRPTVALGGGSFS